jgi:hypothetical protein
MSRLPRAPNGSRKGQPSDATATFSCAGKPRATQPIQSNVEIGMRPLGDRRPARRFAFHAVAPPGLLAFEPWSREIAERDRVAVAIVAIGCTRRAFTAFSPSSKRLPSPADGSVILICRSGASASLFCELEIAKGALADDAHDLKAKPPNSGSLPASPNRERAPNVLRSGLTCSTPDRLWYAACKRCCGYYRSSFSPLAPRRVLMARAADESKSGQTGGGGRPTTILRPARRRIPGARISGRLPRATACPSAGCER